MARDGSWIYFQAAYDLWTGTTHIYPLANGKLRSIAEYTDPQTGERHVAEIPQEYREKGIALMLKSGTYKLERDNNTWLYLPKKEGIVPLEDYPQENGRCIIDAETRAPKARGDGLVGYIRRNPFESILPVHRKAEANDREGRRNLCIGVDFRPSRKLGVLIEGPRGSVPPIPMEEAYEHQSGGD
jgi:hypothetical protein